MNNKINSVLPRCNFVTALMLLIFIGNSHLLAWYCDYINPAEIYLLSKSDKYNYLLKYLNVHIEFLNNSLDLSQFIDNFIKDSEWDSLQKASIFNKIPRPFFSLNGNGIITPIAFSTQLFTISAQYNEQIVVDIPKDLLDLIFWGNNLNRRYDIANFGFSRLSYYNFSLGVNYPIIKNIMEEAILNNFNLGIKFHWLIGRYITQTDSAFGLVLTTPNVLIGEMQIFQRTAKGGNCLAVDIGTQTQFLQSFTLGLAMLNINHGFVWTSEPKYRILSITIDSLSLQRYIEYGSIDSVYHKFDSIKPQSAFKTNSPAQILFQVSYQPNRSLVLKTSYHQYLSKNRFTDNFYRSINCGVHFNFIKYFGSEVSFITDLKHNFAIGTGFYIIIRGAHFSLLISQLNGFFQKSKGIGLDISLGQYW
ncbi:MAG: DUF5723 family protein [candidate division WOR-3 bacterium]